VLTIDRPAIAGDRFRRATRECLLGVAAVGLALEERGLGRGDVEGERTALVAVTAGAYGASNRQLIEAAAAGTLHFPYTAPSAVPAEVAIEFGLRGPYVILIGGPAATIDALWQASHLLSRGACERALVLAVETFGDCEDLFARARWLVGRPLVEAAACAVLEPTPSPAAYVGAVGEPPGRPPRGRATGAPGASTSGALERLARQRAGETLACAPLIGLALALARGEAPDVVTGQGRGRRADIAWTPDDPVAGRSPHRG
jgi:3-oxoacyl-[acyl-carrier-protein] synthase II